MLAGARHGTVIVDMSTSEPALAATIAQEAAVTGVHALDAPVSGGDVGARNGTLSIMVGGDAAALDAVLPYLQALGQTIVHHDHCIVAGTGDARRAVGAGLVE